MIWSNPLTIAINSYFTASRVNCCFTTLPALTFAALPTYTFVSRPSPLRILFCGPPYLEHLLFNGPPYPTGLLFCGPPLFVGSPPCAVINDVSLIGDLIVMT